jgi:hypothetical protein
MGHGCDRAVPEVEINIIVIIVVFVVVHVRIPAIVVLFQPGRIVGLVLDLDCRLRGRVLLCSRGCGCLLVWFVVVVTGSGQKHEQSDFIKGKVQVGEELIVEVLGLCHLVGCGSTVREVG